MSHKHEHMIQAIFQDPPSGNIHWREVESLLNHVGAEIETLQGARIKVRLGKFEGILHRPHHSNVLNRQDIKHLREFLAHGGITPSMHEAGKHQ
jgi:hypothetical protein